MITCRYVGGDSTTIGDREFEAVGQRAVFGEQGFREAVLGGGAFIPEEDFKKIEFHDDHLERFGPVGMRVDPPADFCDKLLRAQEVYRGIRAEMERNAVEVLANVSDMEPEPILGLK